MAQTDISEQNKEAGTLWDAESLEIINCCLFCGSKDPVDTIDQVKDFFFRADHGLFTFLRCGNCGSIWLHQRPIGDRLLKSYNSYYTHAIRGQDDPDTILKKTLRKIYIDSKYGRDWNFISQIAQIMGKLLGAAPFGLDYHYRFAPKSPARILDYGCGGGDFLLRLRALGHEVVGTEFDPHVIKKSAEIGLSVADANKIDELQWHEEFDHVTLSHVLEHVPDPQLLLSRIFGWLKPGGTLYIEVPNANAEGLRIFGRYWRGLEAPRHFALPSRRALLKALEEVGFADPQQFVRRNIRSKMWKECLAAAPEQSRCETEAILGNAPIETFENVEFLTFLMKKPT